MPIIRYAPQPALADCIHALYFIRLEAAPADACHVLVPMPVAHLWFFAGKGVTLGDSEGSLSGAVVTGPRCTPLRMACAGVEDAVVVALKPCALYRFTGLPQPGLTGLCLPATALFGHDADSTLHALLDRRRADGPLAQMRIVETFLLAQRRRLRPAHAFDDTVARLLAGSIPTTSATDELAADCNMSTRQFERICRLRVGFSPKMLTRIVRFAAAFGMKHREPRTRWTEIAARCGYFDQMHLIRDFKQFSGFLPSALSAAGEEGWCEAPPRKEETAPIM